MRVKVYFSSNKHDASTKRFFKIPFEWTAIPPKGTETSVPVETNHGSFVLKGELKDDRINGNLGKVLFGTETSPEDMRNAILPGGLRLREVSDWLAD